MDGEDIKKSLLVRSRKKKNNKSAAFSGVLFWMKKQPKQEMTGMLEEPIDNEATILLLHQQKNTIKIKAHILNISEWVFKLNYKCLPL